MYTNIVQLCIDLIFITYCIPSNFQVDLSSIGQDRFYSALDEAEEDEDEANGVDFQRQEKERLPFAGACRSPDLKVSVL